MENLVKVKLEELGKVFSNKLAIEENIHIKDLDEGIRHASQDLVEDKGNSDLYLCKVEYKDKNGIPSFLEFYEESVVDENDFIIEINYYIEKCDSKYLDKDFLEEKQDEETRESLELIEKLKRNLLYLQLKVDSVYNEDIESTLDSLEEIKKDLMRW